MKGITAMKLTNMKLTNMNDVEFARYLVDKGAIDNWRRVGRSNQWFDENNVIVATAIYGGWKIKRYIL